MQTHPWQSSLRSPSKFAGILRHCPPLVYGLGQFGWPHGPSFTMPPQHLPMAKGNPVAKELSAAPRADFNTPSGRWRRHHQDCIASECMSVSFHYKQQLQPTG